MLISHGPTALIRTLVVALFCCSAVAHADPVRVTDQRGKVIELDAPAQRVIILPKPLPSLVIALDHGTGRLIGLHPAAQAVLMAGWLGDRFPEIADIDTSIVGEGFMPNVEAMLVAKPDVVFQWTSRGPSIIEPMERVGIPVVGISWGTYEIEAGWIEIMGKVLGREDRAKAILDWHAKVRDDIGNVVDAIPEDERTTMLFFDQFGELTVFGRNEYFFQVPGLRNLAVQLDQPTVAIDAEQLLSWDPDIIFLNFYDLEADPQKVYDDPRLADLKAVQNRRVYKTPLLDTSAHEAPLVWSWMAALAYPDKFDTDHRAEIATQLKDLYGVGPDEDQIDEILQMPLNGDSDRYNELFGR
jgi:iron complex transport system substrate-binding protein